MNATTKVLVGVMLAAVLAAPLLAVATYAVTDMSDKTTSTVPAIRTTGRMTETRTSHR